MNLLKRENKANAKKLQKELFKNTWEGHEDHGKLQVAIQKVCETAQLVEDAQEKVFNINKIISISNTLKMSKRIEKEVGKLLQPHRIFLKEGLVKMNQLGLSSSTSSTGADGSQSDHTRKLILFNDLLLVVKADAKPDAKKKKAELATIKKSFFIIHMNHVIKSSSLGLSFPLLFPLSLLFSLLSLLFPLSLLLSPSFSLFPSFSLSFSLSFPSFSLFLSLLSLLYLSFSLSLPP